MDHFSLGKLFWKANYKLALLLLAFIACFALTLSLYNLPMQAILYPSLLCIALLLWFLGAAYLRYRAKYKQLQQLSARLPLPPEAFPVVMTLEDAMYQTLLTQLVSQQKEQAYRAQQAQHEMTQYYTTWVHQIKTPIAALRLLLQTDDTPHGRSCKQELLRVEQYVEMVLAYLRLNTSSTDYLLKPYDIDAIIKQALRRFSTVFIEKKLQLSYQTVSVTVITDEKWLLFVVEQLLSNALKYTPISGTITIAMVNECLTIQDTGIGIAPEDLPRVFENGYTGTAGRLDKSASGIGLYLCHTICARLNHTIQIASTVGQGTTVLLDLKQSALTHE